MPEAWFCRIIVFMWSFGPLQQCKLYASHQDAPNAGLDANAACLRANYGELRRGHPLNSSCCGEHTKITIGLNSGSGIILICTDSWQEDGC